MKKGIVLTILLCSFLSLAVMAQQQNLQGPAAKNAKPWHQKPAARVSVVPAEGSYTGPKAKNVKIWDRKPLKSHVVFMVKDPVTGPKAKNSQPFMKEYTYGELQVK
ncbi:hypothetical protein LVD15_22230 [Fulvivirga maritima]|uniref:hypothetical protein n=1 Tax=Fulvivirga maritima TaxID=2904247 RepID=UPI001F24A3BC|nr:hypothetical protein [Fulvivirga maritima]UII25993.1 hypothetical protein LVD15_22230 [Fulvivirga maritima]